MTISRDDSSTSTHYEPPEVKVYDNKAVRIRDICVHTIRMGDVEDPDLFVADPIYQWQQTDEGKFIMEHAVKSPYWIRSMDVSHYGYIYKIVARLKETDETFWSLKWGIK